MANSLKQYEKKYAQLEEIARSLQDPTMPISTMLAQYKKGLTLVKECSTMLQQVENEMQQIVAEIDVTQ